MKAFSNDSASISRVDFFIGDSLVKTDTRAPYFLRTGSMPGGPFTLTAIATDSEGKQSSKTLNLATSFGGISLDPIDDTYIRGGNNSSTNYGLSDVLKVKASGAAFTRRAFVKFDLTGIHRRVNSAILRLKVKREGNNNYSALFVADDSWQEESLTWDTEPPAGEVIDTSLSAPLEEWMNFDVTAAVAQELEGDKTLSLSLVSDGTSNLELYSGEAGFGNTPVLLINPRNDPSAARVSENLAEELEISTDRFVVYPNPVSFKTTLSYSLDSGSAVQVLITDFKGSVVARYDEDHRSAGRYTLFLEQIMQGRYLRHGVYMVRVIYNKGYFSKKIVVAE